MNAEETTKAQRWPLNESQRQALSIVLATIEQDLQRVVESAQHPPCDGQLTQYIEPLAACNGNSLAELVCPIHKRLRQLATDLQLPPHEDSITRSLTAALLLDEINLKEVEPLRLRGYGAVDAATADYLNHELPRLRALIVALTENLNGRNHDVQLPPLS